LFSPIQSGLPGAQTDAMVDISFLKKTAFHAKILEVSIPILEDKAA
jgi:hypothetical protein